MAAFWCNIDDLAFDRVLVGIRSKKGGHYYSMSNNTHERKIGKLILNYSISEIAVTFSKSFGLNITITIMKPLNLNGGRVVCGEEDLTINLTLGSGKYN